MEIHSSLRRAWNRQRFCHFILIPNHSIRRTGHIFAAITRNSNTLLFMIVIKQSLKKKKPCHGMLAQQEIYMKNKPQTVLFFNSNIFRFSSTPIIETDQSTQGELQSAVHYISALPQLLISKCDTTKRHFLYIPLAFIHTWRCVLMWRRLNAGNASQACSVQCLKIAGYLNPQCLAEYLEIF